MTTFFLLLLLFLLLFLDESKHERLTMTTFHQTFESADVKV